MNRFIYYITLFAVLGFFLNCIGQVNNESDTKKYKQLKAEFKNPLRESGVNCWWWWLNGNVNKATITKDLEAMKARNFQGAMIFDAGGHNQRGNIPLEPSGLLGPVQLLETK